MGLNTGATRRQASVARTRGRRDHQVAIASPLTTCHTPHHAAVIAIPPRPPKKAKTSTRASPELRMPDSMASAREDFDFLATLEF